ncbi:type VII secretion-associated protein [Mycobacterium sp. BMJ-28]
MTAVVLFGPASVRGPHPVRAELVRAALDSLDDRDAIVGDRVVEVSAVLSELVDNAVGGNTHVDDAVVLVCPGWWSTARMDRVRAAAAGRPAETVVLQRADVHRQRHPDVEVIIDIAEDFVLASTSEAALLAVPRRNGVADAVAGALGEPVSVLVDVPGEVPGARALATEIAAALRRRGSAVEIAGDRQLLRAAAELAVPPVDPPARRRWPIMVAAGIAGIAAAAVALPSEQSDESTVVIVEGRVSARVPAGWPVERITAGAGSRRLQAVEPDGHRAILIVQSSAEADMAATAATLHLALQREDPKVFTDFRPAALRAGRPVIGYTEVRAGREIEWSVLLDGGVRIAVGCRTEARQMPPFRAICDSTIGSVHAVATNQMEPK